MNIPISRQFPGLPQVEFAIVQPGIDLGLERSHDGAFVGGRSNLTRLWTGAEAPSSEDRINVASMALQNMRDHIGVPDGIINRSEILVIRTETRPRVVRVLGHAMRIGHRKENTILEAIPLGGSFILNL